MTTNNQRATFSQTELSALRTLIDYARSTFEGRARWTFEQRDGDGYGLLELFGETESGPDWFPVQTVQLSNAVGRRFALLADDPRLPPWLVTDDLDRVVDELKAAVTDILVS